MTERIRILAAKLVYEGWAKITRYRFAYRREDGSSQDLVREIYDHGHAAAVLLFDKFLETVVLVRQFRLPALLNGDSGWTIEVCAGLLDGDAPEDCARRETLEETGYRVGRIDFAFRAMASPGAVTEIVHCFVGEYDAGSKMEAGGGLAQEGEEIEVLEMTLEHALGLVASGEIYDGKTIMLLQHLALREAAAGRS